MITRTNNLDQVVNGSEFIDGFISTDAGEFDHYLREMLGFHPPSDSFKKETKIGDSSWTLVKGNDKVPLEYTDLEVPTFNQAKKYREDFGFVPMVWFRLYSSGQTASRELVNMGKVLLDQRQNLAVLGQNNLAYVALSEFHF